MRPVAFVLSAAFVLAIIAGQNSLFRLTQAETVTTPATVLSNTVLTGGCSHADLHIVRYVPAGARSQRPLVATWCS